MPRHGAADDLARLRIERRVQRQRAVPVVLEPVAFSASGRERQQRINPVERLDRRLLVNAEDDGVLRRIELEPITSAAYVSKSGSVERM